MAVEARTQAESSVYRMRLEAALTPLRRRQAELQKQLAAMERRPPSGATQLDVAVAKRQRAREITSLIEDHMTLLESIEAEARRVSEEAAARPAPEPEPESEAPVGVQELQDANDMLGAELARARREVHSVLSGLAGPLRRYDELVAYKTEASRQLAAATGKDRSYANYIECALIRQSEFDGDLRYVVELLKRLHVAS